MRRSHATVDDTLLVIRKIMTNLDIQQIEYLFHHTFGLGSYDWFFFKCLVNIGNELGRHLGRR
jgi:hypothetical protein